MKLRRLPPPFSAYAVSRDGRIWSSHESRYWVDDKKWHVRTTQTTNSGYLKVDLAQAGHKVTVYVHSLVASAYLGPANGLEVNHKDGIKTHNASDNLEYVTRLQNVQHAEATGLSRHAGPSPEKSHKAKLDWDKVREIRAHPEVALSVWAKKFGVDKQSIWCARSGKTWRTR